jgi:transcription initiation factor IIE alpha subunit
MTERLLEQDLQNVLAMLQESPKTPSELVINTHLSAARITILLAILQERRLVHAPRSVESARGYTVSVWELLPVQESLDLLPPSPNTLLEQQDITQDMGEKPT